MGKGPYMAKKRMFPEPKKMLGAKPPPAMPMAMDTPHKMPKEMRIREADGGFIVSNYDTPGDKEKVYKSVSALKKCVAEKFGGGKEDIEE